MFGNLDAEIARYRISRKSIMDATGMSEKTLRNKLSGATQFSLREMILIRSLIPSAEKLPLDYLFDDSDPN